MMNNCICQRFWDYEPLVDRLQASANIIQKHFTWLGVIVKVLVWHSSHFSCKTDGIIHKRRKLRKKVRVRFKETGQIWFD